MFILDADNDDTFLVAFVDFSIEDVVDIVRFGGVHLDQPAEGVESLQFNLAPYYD